LHIDLGMSAPRSILVPVDGSPASVAALEHAAALAEDGGARVDVLHVEAPEVLGSPLSPSTRGEIQRALDEAVDRASARLPGRVSRRTAHGDPLRTILETAGGGGYDLIVMGTHGRIGRLHSMLGSVAEGVVRNAPCPVLTVRDASGGYQSFAERRHGRLSVAEQGRHRP
jgi:nucleotide-binding universal stress UspA family protein